MTHKQIVKHYGSVAEAARRTGLSRQTLYNWKNANKVPKEWQAWFQVDSGGYLVMGREAR